MRFQRLVLLLAIVLTASAAVAQEQRGSIDGIVKDSSGAVLPGATVEANNPATGATLATFTDASGRFRFPSVQTGTYAVTASLGGFRPMTIPDVLVALGQIKTLDFSLPVAGVAESVEVTAFSPVIDVKQSTRATNIRAEQVELLPHNRDFTSLITQAPGANLENKSGNGVSIDGASSAENRYVVDGMETTDVIKGQSGKDVLADFVEEVQVKSSGYSAEYGGSTGAVINVITKSGTNQFHGSALTYWQGDRVAGAFNPSLRLQLTNSNASEYITYPEDKDNRVEPGGSLGGPVSKNKAWFFGAYQPAFRQITRTVTPASSGNAAAATIAQTRKREYQFLTANETMQVSDTLRTRVAFNNSWYQEDGQLPSQNGTDNPSTNYAKGNKQPNWSLSGNADYVITPALLFGLRAGYFRTNSHDYNVPDQTRFVFNSSNIGMAGVPPSLQHGSNFNSILSNNAILFDLVQRKYVQGDLTWYGRAAGAHQIKGGVQIDLRSENINSGNLEQVVTLNWGNATTDPSGKTVTGPFGYYQVTSNAAAPRQGFITQGDVKSNVYGFFIQDAWALTDRLTLNLGVRTETEKVPAYDTGDVNQLGTYPIQFGFKDKLAPRAGFAYDIKGDGSWKAFGSWGMFYDIFKLDLGQQSFGGAKWIEWYFTLDNPNFESLNSNSNCPPACSGTFITKINERLPSLNQGDVSADLKPMREQEAAFGLEHQLAANMAVTVRYIHKQLDRGIEDTGAIIPETDDELYVIANPGEGLPQTFNVVNNSSAYAGASGQYTLPKPRRDYNGVEFAFDKRLSSRWSFHGSYLVSRLSGNYPGLAESDEATGSTMGRVDPNIGRSFDYPIESFDGHGQPLYGVLPTGRPHQAKGQFIYQLPIGTSVGLSEYVASGIPISRAIQVEANHNYPLYYLGRNSDGRTPVLSQTDLYVQHDFRLPTGKRLQINANVLNLFDQRAVTNKFNNMRRTGSALNINETAFYAGQVNVQSLIDAAAFPNGSLRLDPRFLLASDYQSPLQARFGVKFLF
ncbi:MAG TPA: TonB-dependent receptor [Vicinamibacterales bacterium]|nr:TonB-dependent receptor [Vicinamibacterales bacterium]